MDGLLHLRKSIFGGARSVAFLASFADAGAGIVNTGVAPGIGPATFTRASTATTILSTRLIGNVATGQPRSYYTPAGVYVGYLPEGSRKNVVLQSENFGTTWVISNTPTRVAASDTCGSVVLDLIGDDSAAALEGYTQSVTFTGDAVKAVSFFVKGGTSTSSDVELADLTAVAIRLRCTIAWSGGVPTPTCSIGTLEGTDALGNSVYRIRCVSTAVTAANNNSVQVFPATDNVLSVANIGNMLCGGVQAEDAAFCSTYIPTTTGTVTRAADVLTYPTAGNWFDSVGAFSYEANAQTWANTTNLWVIGVSAGGQPGTLSSATSGLALFDGTNTRNGPVAVPSGTMKHGGSWTGSTMMAWANGTSTTGTFDGSMNSTGTMGVGCLPGGTGQPFTAIRNLKLYSRIPDLGTITT